MDNVVEILIPIIFFVIWIFSSIAEAKKKRSRQQQPSPRPTNYPVPQPQPGASKPPSSSSNPMDELRRSLDTIFGEMGSESNENEEPQPAAEYHEEAEITPEYHKREEVVPIQPPVQTHKESYRDRLKQEQLQVSKFYDNYGSEQISSVNISRESLRKAIVLMEVLSPPVALKE